MRSKVRAAGKADPNSWMRLETLRYVSEHEQSTMRDLASYLRITAPSATSLITGLVRRKLIAREQDKKDKRVARLRLSRQGKALLSAYEKNSITLMKEVFSKLGSEDTRKLVRILKALDSHHRA
jgi:DNA-binding MarR family transcriptional regulator